MVQDLWESEYKDLELNDSKINLPASKQLKTSSNRFTAWRTQKRGLATGGLSLDKSPAPSPGSSITSQYLDEYEQWQHDINESDALVTDPYKYWHRRHLQYPRLSRMALDLLTVPPMSTECDRQFSITGHMVTKSW